VDAGWAAAYALTILGGQFDRCGAGSSGGAVAAVVEEGVASVAVLVDDTAFDGSWLYSSAGSVKGGHIYFSYSGDATNTNTTIRRSNFTNGILTGSGGNAFGGCDFEYGATVTKAHQQIESCIFRNNTLVGSVVYGGGMQVVMRGESTEMALIFLLCLFAHNVLRGASGYSLGGGVAVFMRGESTEMAFIIRLCLFAHNVVRARRHPGQKAGGSAVSQGAGVYKHFYRGAVRSVLLLVERSAFESNVALAIGAAGTAGGAGLDMVVAAEATNMTTTIAHCSFSSNTVRPRGRAEDYQTSEGLPVRPCTSVGKEWLLPAAW
jgi:hypothetical protein